MLKAVLFDLDGTLLPMNEEEFTNGYFGFLCKRLEKFGYEKEKLIETIWAGTKKMILNDGSKTNEQAFWQNFSKVYGEEKLKDKAEFDDFYKTEFKRAKIFCGENKFAREIVDYAKSKGLKIILSSNPLFPREGMITRLGFVGLKEEDFNEITSYENYHYAKPNPKYFQEILTKNNLRPEEVVLFGNSEIEDCNPASACQIKCYLIGNCLSISGQTPAFEVLKYNNFKAALDKEIENRK